MRLESPTVGEKHFECGRMGAGERGLMYGSHMHRSAAHRGQRIDHGGGPPCHIFGCHIFGCHISGATFFGWHVFGCHIFFGLHVQ